MYLLLKLLMRTFLTDLSPGQTDRQVIASGRKLSLRRDLRQMAKRLGLASFLASTGKSSISLANDRLIDVTQLALIWVGWQTVKNLCRLACKFDLGQSERKSSQVNANAGKPWPNGVASRPKFNLLLLTTPFGQGFRYSQKHIT